MSSSRMQAGCLPVRRSAGHLEVLLVTSRYTGEWIAPKGSLEPGEPGEAAALREAEEEAGVRGTLGARLGCFDYPYGRIEIYVLEVESELESWPEQLVRRRRWFTLDEALAAARRPEVRAMLQTLGLIL